MSTEIRYSLVSHILRVLKNEWIDWWRSGFLYILTVSRLLNNIRETYIAFQVNKAETALFSKYFTCLRKHACDTFTKFIVEFTILDVSLYNFNKAAAEIAGKTKFSETNYLYWFKSYINKNMSTVSSEDTLYIIK